MNKSFKRITLGLDGKAQPVQLIHPTNPFAWSMLQAVAMQTVVNELHWFVEYF